MEQDRREEGINPEGAGSRLKRAFSPDVSSRDGVLATYQSPRQVGVDSLVRRRVAHVQKTASKAQQLISREFLTRIYEEDGPPTGIELSTTRPRQVVVIGSLRESRRRRAPSSCTGHPSRTSRQSTFDELYERACFIVEDH